MSKKHYLKHSQAIRRTTIKQGEQTMFSMTMVVLLVVGLLVGFELFGSNEQSKAEIRIEAPVVLAASTVTAITESDKFLPHDPTKSLVGIVSGHKGYDSGAVCADGLTEAENPVGEPYGEDRLSDAIKKFADKPASSIRDDILEDVDVFCDGNPPFDDITMLVVCYTG